MVDVAFVGNLGRHLLQSENLNTLPYGKRFLPSSQDPTTGKPLPDSFLTPYIGIGSITYAEPVGTSNYYALQTASQPALLPRRRVQGKLDLVQVSGLRLRR